MASSKHSREIDLWAPFERDTILEIRSGKLKKYKGLNIESGIEKTILDGPIFIGKLGIDGDEHDLTFHGGVDKAVHGYCSTHYPTWQSEFPSAAAAFTPGGFGENLVTAHMNERNVCIGDTVSLGDPLTGPLLQVSLPRQPCFKLNVRFSLKNFAPKTWRYSRTGWYYRVLRQGWVRAGDEIRLVARPHPQWTIERVQEYLHRTTDNGAMNAELAEIVEMGAESRDTFVNRVAKQKAKERRDKNVDDEESKAAAWRTFRIVSKKKETARVVSIVMEAVDKVDKAELGEGAHAKMQIPIPGNETPLVRSYSVVSGDRNKLEFGITLEPNSRGASKYLHETAQVGDTLQIGRLTAMPLLTSASCHVFIAAGIGITAFLSLLEQLRHYNFAAQLHYAVRSVDNDMPFRDRIEKLGPQVVTVYDKSAGQRLCIANVIQAMPWNSRLYFCGPSRLMDEALRETRAAGIASDEVHFEAFSADTGGDPFEAVVKNRGEKLVKVGEEETLLQVLQRTFGVDDVPSSCEVGNCGTCKLTLKSGRVEHRGTALLEEDKAGSMLSCVSRGIGQIAVEI